MIEPWVADELPPRLRVPVPLATVDAHEAHRLGMVNRVCLARSSTRRRGDRAQIAQAPLSTLMAIKAGVKRAWETNGCGVHLQSQFHLMWQVEQAGDVAPAQDTRDKGYGRFRARSQTNDGIQRAESVRIRRGDHRARADRSPERADRRIRSPRGCTACDGLFPRRCGRSRPRARGLLTGVWTRRSRATRSCHSRPQAHDPSEWCWDVGRDGRSRVADGDGADRMDLQRASAGRFNLGLGTQVKMHNERRFSVPFESPGPKLREQVLALKHIWGAFQGEHELSFNGRFYRHDYLTPFFNPGPIERPHIPVWLAAVKPYMYGVVGEVADGVRVHTLHHRAVPARGRAAALHEGLERSGREPEAVAKAASVFVCVEPGQEEFVRSQIAFYGSTRTYGRSSSCTAGATSRTACTQP